MQCEHCGASTFVNHGDGSTVLCGRCAALPEAKSLLAQKEKTGIKLSMLDRNKQQAVQRGIMAALAGAGIAIIIGYLHAQSLCGSDGGGVIRGLCGMSVLLGFIAAPFVAVAMGILVWWLYRPKHGPE